MRDANHDVRKRRNSRYAVWYKLAGCLLIVMSWGNGISLAQDNVPHQNVVQNNGAPTDEVSLLSTQESSDDLPWQPGLSQPLAQTQMMQTPAIQTPANSPAAAVPMQGAQPLVAQPLATSPQTGAGFPVPQEHSLIVPAAFLEDAADQPAANANGNPDNRGQVIDSRITTVRQGLDVLPNTAGQVWRTYDISPYTYAIQGTDRPQQAVIDWVLKETGTDLWFQEPMGVMNATREQLHIYHTPAIQDRVKAIVDRLVQTRGTPHIMGLRLLTISNPDWRSLAFPMLQPIEVSSPGVEAWLISKENAALLTNQLRNRADYQEHSVADLIVNDGQKYVMSKTRPISFLRSLALVNDGTPRYQPIQGQIDEGYSLEFSSLRSLDGATIEAIIGCQVDQVEKIQPVKVDIPTMTGVPQTVELQIPQMVSWRINERFLWPSDQVLLLSCGVVATPGPQPQGLMGLQSIFNGTRRRADALMFVDFKGAAQNAVPPVSRNANSAGNLMPINPQR